LQRIKNLNALRDALRAESRLEDVAAYYKISLTGNGENLKACCPFHQEDTPSFSISTTKQLFFCFGCKEGGDVFSFVQKMEQCPYDQALKKMADVVKLNLTPYLAEQTDEDRRNARLYEINEWVGEICFQGASEVFDKWVSDRKFDLHTLSLYRIGHSYGLPPMRSGDLRPDWEALKMDWQTMWTDVIVVPVCDAYGRLAGFRNRLLNPGKVKVLGPVESHPLAVPQVYGLYEARAAIRSARGECVLVEGECDVWQMVGAGFGNTCAMQGTKLNDAMLSYLGDSGVTRITVLADNDDAGRKFTRQLSRAKLNSKILIKIATLRGEGADPDEAIILGETEQIRDSIRAAKYRFEYLIDIAIAEEDITRMTGKLDVLHEVRPFITKATQVEQELAYAYLGEKLGLDRVIVADFFREDATNQESLTNVPAEKIVLARMLRDTEFVGEAILALRPGDFYLDKHQAIFDAMGRLYRASEDITPDVVRSYLANKSKITLPALETLEKDIDVSGASYLLSDLRDKATRRAVIQSAKRAASRLADTNEDTSRVIQAFSGELAVSIVGAGEALQSADSLVQARIRQMHERIKEPNAIIGLDLGPDWKTLSLALHGIQRGHYGIVAGPAGSGKSTIGIGWAAYCATALNEPTLVLTYETGPEALTNRMMSHISGIEQDKIITGYISEEQIAKVHDAAAMIAKSPLVITNRGATLEEAISIIRHDVLRRGTRIVFIDYIQLMNLADPGRMGRYLELGQISRAMLLLAAELNISIVCIAQLNREGIKAGTNAKENIGESYKIIQDCDWAYIIRELTKDEINEKGPSYGDAFGLLDKNRHGRDGVGSGLIRDLAVMRIREVRKRDL
jgi:replicative DNA helicase/5S rRNA maturation endonuclease (ribonuclease M5)